MSSGLILPLPHSSRSTEQHFYRQDLNEMMTPEVRRFFLEYSKIPKDEQDEHIRRIRKLAWDVFPWPCLGEFWFLRFGVSRHPRYTYLLGHLKTESSFNPPLFLDLGTCLGQDLRILAFDGAPIQTLYGHDCFSEYFQTGNMCFRDGDRLTADHFIIADILSQSPSSPLLATAGSWTAINASMLLHIWDLPTQEQVALTMLSLLRKEPGSFIMGTSMGSVLPGEIQLKPSPIKKGEQMIAFMHSRDTMRQMWERVGHTAGVELRIEVQYDEEEVRSRQEGWSTTRYFQGEDQRRVFFFVELPQRSHRPEWRVFG